MTVIETQKRDSGLDILRIFAMCLIVGSHIIGHCIFNIYPDTKIDVDYYLTGNLLNRWICLFFVGGGDVGNYIFFLLMGYFFDFYSMFYLRLRKIIKLSVEIYFYAIISILILIVSIILGINNVLDILASKNMIMTLSKHVLPVTSELWWFITTYILILLIWGQFSFLDKLTLKQWKIFLLCYYLINAIRINSGSYNKLFIDSFVVLLGFFIRKHHFNFTKKLFFMWLLILIISSILTSKIQIKYYEILGTENTNYMFRTLCDFCARQIKLLFAISCLFIFSNIKLCKYSAKITPVASATLSVYLLHGSPFFVDVFMHKISLIKSSYSQHYFPAIFLCTIILIYICALLLNYIQIKFNKKVVARIGKIAGGKL